MRTFYEFFAGGGMARAGLGQQWTCLFANDFDPKKVDSYRANWGPNEVRLADVNDLTVEDLPGHPDLVWASFPCQDLSLAGGGAGLKGNRSGTFWPFWSRIEGLTANGRQPRLVVLENVHGMLSSHRGKDFAAIGRALANAGYRFGAVLVDAAHFLPQSRKRVFIIATTVEDLTGFTSADPQPTWHPKAVVTAASRLTPEAHSSWVWWNLPQVVKAAPRFEDIFEANPADVRWHTSEETAKLLNMMSEHNHKKLQEARRRQPFVVGTMYRRTRPTPTGGVQRAEIRLDGTAGCLRTPSGGSSRQIVVYADRKTVRTRLISAREAARLMGLADSYQLPDRYNDAYHLLGDGLAIPAVKFIADQLLTPLTSPGMSRKEAA